MSTLQELEDLVPDYQYVDGDRVVLTVGIRATFYFWGGHSAPKRKALVECVEAYEQAYGKELAWAFDVEQHKVVPFAKMPTLRKLVQAMDDDDQVEWYASSCDDDEAVGEYRISALTERGWQSGEMSVVSFTLPRDHAFVPEKREKLLELARLFVAKLSPFHGHIGLAAVSTYEQYQYQSDEIDVATRYRGLFVEYPAIDVSQAHNGLKSVDWVTFIGKPFAERMGGQDVVAGALRAKAIAFEETTEGLFAYAGTEPDIAPVERGLPSQLALVNAVLRPLRNGAFGSMGFGSIDGELRFNRCTSDLWIRRLDAPEIWPPGSFVGLPREPIFSRPEKKQKIKTGDTCSIHGRYRFTASGKAEEEQSELPEVVMLPGDIAPYWLKLGPHGELLRCELVTWELIGQL